MCFQTVARLCFEPISLYTENMGLMTRIGDRKNIQVFIPCLIVAMILIVTPLVHADEDSTNESDRGFVQFTYKYWWSEKVRAEIRLCDLDLNTNPYVQETAKVFVRSTSDHKGIPFTVEEVSTSSYEFKGWLEFTMGCSEPYKALHASDCDIIEVGYWDESHQHWMADSGLWTEEHCPEASKVYGICPRCTGTPLPRNSESEKVPGNDNHSELKKPCPTRTPYPAVSPTSTPLPWTANDRWGYTGTTEVPFDWIDAKKGQKLSISGNYSVETVNLPFPFPYYGKQYTKLRISDNGYITFDVNSDQSWVCNLPSEIEPNDVIAPFCCDLRMGDTGNVYFLDSGSFVTIEWDLVRNNRGGQDSYTFEVSLYQDGRIKIQYYVMSGNAADGWGSVVGIEDSLGFSGLRYRKPGIPGEVFDGLAIHFTPPKFTPTPVPAQSLDYKCDFEDGCDGWITTGLWHIVDKNTDGEYARSHSGSKCFYYGFDSCRKPSRDIDISGSIISPPIKIEVDPEKNEDEKKYLSFWSSGKLFGFFVNFCSVSISSDGLNFQNPVYRFDGSEDEVWQKHIIDISDWIGKTIRIQIQYFLRSHEGFSDIRVCYSDVFYIDDMAIKGNLK